jgi:serine/threonine protein phosphatase PrpC
MQDSLEGSCPECGTSVAATDNFCERCGRELAVAQVTSGSATVAICRSCGSSDMTAEGYCERCGQKAPPRRDHVEIDLDGIVGVSDRGMRHHRNEDAMALVVTETPAGSAELAVVCDGVSTSDRPDEASLTAAEAAIRVLAAAVRAGTPSKEALVAATGAAQNAVGDMADQSADSPATTIVCAVVSSEAVTVCWVGDSRAYWLPAASGSGHLDVASARLLTRDDSVAGALVTAGALTEAEAAVSPNGHVLTRWLGADAKHSEPHTTQFEPGGPGMLLLCSDGFWNYQPSAEGLAGLAPPDALASLRATAAGLLEFAIGAGGADNITVVLASFPPT